MESFFLLNNQILREALRILPNRRANRNQNTPKVPKEQKDQKDQKEQKDQKDQKASKDQNVQRVQRVQRVQEIQRVQEVQEDPWAMDFMPDFEADLNAQRDLRPLDYLEDQGFMNIQRHFLVRDREVPVNFPMMREREREQMINTANKKEKLKKEFHPLCLTECGRVVASSENGLINVFKMQPYKVELTIRGHREYVSYILLLSNGSLATACCDGVIKIWKLGKTFYTCVHTFYKHRSIIYKLVEISGKYLVSVSEDKTIKIHELDSPYALVRVLEGHPDPVLSLVELKNLKYLVSGGEKELRFWKNRTYVCEHTMKDIECSNADSMIENDNQRLIIGGRKSKIYIVDCTSFTLETIVQLDDNPDNNFYISSIINLFDGTFAFCFNGKVLRIENDDEYKVTQIENQNHCSNIKGLMLYKDSFFVTSSEYFCVQLWKFQSNKSA